MPKSSDRQQLLAELDHVLSTLAFFGEENSEFFKQVLHIYFSLRSVRNLNPREDIPKTSSMLDLVWQYDDKEFKIIARMNKRSFLYILHMIKDNRVFKNKSNHRQAPVWVQLLVALNRLGCDGNGSSIDRNAMFAGVSHGSVELFTSRAFKALLSHHDVFISWPNEIERAEISRRFNQYHGMPDCVGVVDGTPINFAAKPHIDGETYWSRKSRYCINLQLICDDRRNIRFYQTGWPGSVFDSTVFDNSEFCRKLSEFLKAGHIILIGVTA